ncbi:hypothetical protein EC991_009147, partial [Linnemannia zychae]
FLGPTYLDRFKPQPLDRYTSSSQNLFQEAVIAPFSKDQVKSYVDQYAQDPQTAVLFRDQAVWLAEEYMDKLTVIPNVMDLVKNPFLLTLALKALPGLVASNENLSSIRVTRARLYDMFIDQWLEMNRLRLQSTTLNDNEQEALNALIDDDFIAQGIDYLLRLSTAIFKEQEGNPIVQYNQRLDKNSWKANFFGSDPEVKLLRDASPLMRTGNQYRFIHRSVLEYLFSRVIYNPTRIVDGFDSPTETGTHPSQLLDADGPLFQRDLLKEPSVIQFLCDRVRLSPIFEQQLRAIINHSKTHASATRAATNSITILVRAGIAFHGTDLRGVRIPGADLSNGQFDSAQFQGADLKGANLARTWLRLADFSGASMEDVTFGELPYLEVDYCVEACCFSPSGRMLAMALASFDGFIYIYDTSTWTRTHCLKRYACLVPSIVFSPDSRRIVSGSSDGTFPLWDTTSGEMLLVMKGHSDYIASVAFSPCGSRIASASDDRTIRLWDTQTGECLFVLKGHSSKVKSVKYSPDGRQVVSGSYDETIRFWDSETGEPGNVLSPSCDYVKCVVYSPDGRWVAAGHWKGHLQLWDANTLKPGPVLSGHTGAVTGIDFSPDGQWIASSSEDWTVRLWDASTGTLTSIMAGHTSYAKDVSFSLDSLCIASAGFDKKVRLWEVSPRWSSSEQQDQTLSVLDVMYSVDGRDVLSCTRESVQQWDSLTGVRGPALLKLPQLTVLSLTSLPDDKRVVISSLHDYKYLKNLQDDTARIDLSGILGRNDTPVFSPCGHWIISLSRDAPLRFWDFYDLQQGDLLSATTVEPIKDQATSAVFSFSGRHLAVGYSSGTVRIFDSHTRDLLITKRLVDNKRVRSLAFSPSGLQLAVGTHSNLIRLWDLHSEKPSIELETEGDYPGSIAYSTCDQWIASVGSEKAVRTWYRRQDTVDESWSSATTIRGFFDTIQKIAWNPVIPLELATACRDGSVRVWRILSGNGRFTVNMLWGSNLRMLCAVGTDFKDVTGLGPTQQQLLLQRGAINSTLFSK